MSPADAIRQGTVIAHYGIAVGVRFETGEEVRLPLRRSQSYLFSEMRSPELGTETAGREHAAGLQPFVCN